MIELSTAAWDALINYWALTGDDTYNDQISEAMTFQVGQNNDYMPVNQSASIGNDNQATWALAAMTAAENNFPPPKSLPGTTTWRQLAQKVFDDQVARWDVQTCSGGLRWSVYPTTVGYTYKNSLSNGDFMQLAARLAVYTGNQTYTKWAEKTSTWSLDVGLIEQKSFDVFDGASTSDDCKNINRMLWTGNVGTYISGNAYLSSVSAANATYTADLVQSATRTFASNGSVIQEVACISQGSCDNNPGQLALLPILAKALAHAKYVGGIQLASLNAVLQVSAKAAAASCTRGPSGTLCGSSWYAGGNDTTGLGQELSALQILLANIPSKTGSGSSNSSDTSGNSTDGNASASTGSATGLAVPGVALVAALALASALVL